MNPKDKHNCRSCGWKHTWCVCVCLSVPCTPLYFIYKPLHLLLASCPGPKETIASQLKPSIFSVAHSQWQNASHT